jgi:hypothetical protein
LRDRRLHIVAAPGAGKTSLGLEVFRRIGRPALVLAPTLTIRDQWILRLADFGAGEATSWASTDLSTPGFLTVTTYQAVLARSRRDASKGRAPSEDAPASVDLAAEAEPSRDDEASLIELLRHEGVGTLILDEAHHLKGAWWRSLSRVVDGIDGLRLVALTGTPPYDASGVEWLRYEELCGPIDEEISVPELVRAGTLCPHQDFVYAVAPLGSEAEIVREHDVVVQRTLEELIDDPDFQSAIEGHPWLGPEPPIDEVLDDPGLAVALLCYAQATRTGGTEGLAAALDLSGEALPALDRSRWELLLRAYLFGTTFALDGPDEEGRRRIAGRLRESGLLWRRQLRLATSPDVDRALALSAGKLEACIAIHEEERAVRGEALRQVFLFDFIRDGALDSEAGAGPRELGAFPVFDQLRRPDVALITGRLAAIHESRIAALEPEIGPDALSPLPWRPGWHRIAGVSTGAVVAAMTRLLTSGTLHVLVGTRSLLGEGWDAPVVNSVVLGSYVGAFVSTNQMRGRAIRTDPADADKVASVWHIAALQHGTPTGHLDYERLADRFRTFVGLSGDGAVIESGLERLDLPPLGGANDLSSFNRASLARLRRLPEVAAAWTRAIEGSTVGQVVPTVSFRSPPTMRPLHVTRTLHYLLLELLWASVFTLGSVLRGIAGGAGVAVMIGATVPMLILAPKLVRAARLALLHAPVDGSVKAIARAVAGALSEAALLDEPELVVCVHRERDGSVLVSVDGGSFRDQSLFADSLAEVLGPIGNPRYLITRARSGPGWTRSDVHAVPTVFGTKRNRAETFCAAWLENVGVGELVYTRREGGRSVLLAARARSFAGGFEAPGRRLDRWR